MISMWCDISFLDFVIPFYCLPAAPLTSVSHNKRGISGHSRASRLFMPPYYGNLATCREQALLERWIPCSPVPWTKNMTSMSAAAVGVRQDSAVRKWEGCSDVERMPLPESPRKGKSSITWATFPYSTPVSPTTSFPTSWLLLLRPPALPSSFSRFRQNYCTVRIPFTLSFH